MVGKAENILYVCVILVTTFILLLEFMAVGV